MSVPVIILSVLNILLAVTMIVLFLVQEGNDRGMGVVGGVSTDSYFSKTKGRSLEERLKSATKLVAVCFAVVSVVLYLAISRGF